MSSGLLFIWVHAHVLSQTLDALALEKFQYVENVSWIRKDIGNKFVCDHESDEDTFRHSKMTLLVCRKVRRSAAVVLRDCVLCLPQLTCASLLQISSTSLELMHQRNPDVVFDFVRQEAGRDSTSFALDGLCCLRLYTVLSVHLR